MPQKFINSKEKTEIKPYALCLQNSSKDHAVNSMIKTRLNVYVYDFPIDCNIFNINDIINIHKYLVKKHDIR